MQEQNFEKQVQHKLEELSLTPSAPVWQKVENEIREKKKRRRLIAFWLFPFLLGAGTFWGIVTLTTKNDQQSSQIDTSTQIEKKQASISIDKQPATITSTEQVEPSAIASGSPSTEVASQGSPAAKSTNVSVATLQNKPTLVTTKKADPTKRTGNQKGKLHVIAKTNKEFTPARREKNESALLVSPVESESITLINEPEQNLTTERKIELIAKLERSSTSSVQALQEIITLKENQLKPVISSDSAQNKQSQEKERKWSWAIQASYGIASLQTDFLSKAFGAPLAYSDPQLNSGFPTTPTPIALQQPSRMENGAALHAGIYVKRNINKRFAVTAGLQYSYLTIKNNVGQTVVRDTIIFNAATVDRVVNQFYRPVQNSSQLQEYVNKYHYLELPLGVEWKVNKRLPLHIQTGLSLSYLFKNNALVYDPNARIYYQDNDLFSKLQLQFFSGITYRVWQHKNLGIDVGPYLQYGLSSLEKEDKNHHLLSTGLKAAFSF